jgi:hypothetical protein
VNLAAPHLYNPLLRVDLSPSVNNVKEDGPDLPEPRSVEIEEPVLVQF